MYMLKKIRQEKRITQKELAEMTSIPLSTLRKYEQGVIDLKKCEFTKIKALSNVLQVRGYKLTRTELGEEEMQYAYKNAPGDVYECESNYRNWYGYDIYDTAHEWNEMCAGRIVNYRSGDYDHNDREHSLYDVYRDFEFCKGEPLNFTFTEVVEKFIECEDECGNKSFMREFYTKDKLKEIEKEEKKRKQRMYKEMKIKK